MFKTISLLLPLLTVLGLVHARAGINDQIVFLQESNASILRYPSQFTQGIIPKQIHSHNDYWREVPLLSAISLGVASVEADVWFINNTLYVGHEAAALTPDRTFDSLYVQPLLHILEAENPKTRFTVNQGSPRGVFDTTSDFPLQLLVEIKTDGRLTLPPVLKALEPLRQKGYLSTFANGSLVQSTITVIGTGNTPLDDVKALSPRDFFFDGPLTGLKDPSLNTTWDPTLTPLASTDFEAAVGWSGTGNISDAQLAKLAKLVADAKSLNIKSRFWNTPSWPISARNAVWRVLIDSGASWLNADDIVAASNF